jgi:hypothetical protein
MNIVIEIGPLEVAALYAQLHTDPCAEKRQSEDAQGAHHESKNTAGDVVLTEALTDGSVDPWQWPPGQGGGVERGCLPGGDSGLDAGDGQGD